MPDQFLLPLEKLLPLRGAVVTLRFLAATELNPFHQPALTAFVRSLLGSPKDYDLLLTLDAPEQGRTHYRSGDRYRFALLALAGGEELLGHALARLAELPHSAPRRGQHLPFTDNLVLEELADLFSGQPLAPGKRPSPYAKAHLQQEADHWQGRVSVRLRWRSPVRLLLDKARRAGRRGESRYCRRPADLPPDLLAGRLHDALADLLRRRGESVPPRGPAPALSLAGSDLFWVDGSYRDESGTEQVMGGMCGLVDLLAEEPEALDWRPWVLGQYLGIGQRRAFGWGRYRLEDRQGRSLCHRPEAAASVLESAAEAGNLVAAYGAIVDNLAGDDPRREPEDEAWVAEDLERLGGQLLTARYQPSPLRGVILNRPDGGLRPLAIPPFMDRVAQRAVAQVLGPGLERLFAQGSFGYRPRRSREDVRALIQAAHRQGYRWVYESDIDDFFDSVDHHRLENRLRALYGDDPLVSLMLGWMAAPVDYQGRRISREAGLPQGAPLSPLLANLMLDDFDSDLESEGFKLVRFADDFVILCRDREEAEAASQAAEAALAEVGLRLNRSKTGIRSFERGFRYLGYLFVGELALEPDDEPDDEQSPKEDAAPQPPPGSWLARLASRQPQPLAEADRRPKPPPPPTAETPEALLIITGPVATVTTREGRLCLEREGEASVSIPWSGLKGVVLFGPHHLSTPALKAALTRGVPIHFATGNGRYEGCSWNGQPGPEGWGLWLEQQTAFVEPGRALEAARAVVEARLIHQREVLRQRADPRLAPALEGLDRLRVGLEGVTDSSALNGLEGRAARVYFEALALLVPEEFGFGGRNRRPPRDPFNALLSLGYTVLHAHCETVLRADGLLPWFGFYHGSHGRHAALASDLMEPFRHLVERVALRAVTRRMLKPGDFHEDGEKGVRMSREGRRRYLGMLAERFDTPVGVMGGPPRAVDGHLHQQNLELIAWIRGRAVTFRAWRMR